jgi:hypothetical protein
MAFKVQAQIFVHGSISITPALHQGMEHDTKLMHGTARHVTATASCFSGFDQQLSGEWDQRQR